MSENTETIRKFLERRYFLEQNIAGAKEVLNHIRNGYTISMRSTGRGADAVTPGEIAKVTITKTIAEYEKELKHIDSRIDAMAMLASAPSNSESKS